MDNFNESQCATPSTTFMSDANSMPPYFLEKDSNKPAKKKPRKNSSKVWLYFLKNQDGSRCNCIFCGQDYAYDPRNNGTTTLWAHLEKCKRNPNKKKDPGQMELAFQKNIESGGDSNLVAVTFSKEACRKVIAEMILIDELPFRHVEGVGFRKMLSVFEPRFEPPSRMTVARDVLKTYLDQKEKLKRSIIKNAQRVCLTTDCWTSLQKINYMCLTCHYIDCDWKLQKRILNFCQVVSHKGEVIGKTIEGCLIDWGIDKVFTITVDNASSNDTAIGYLKRRINGWKGLILDGEFMHMRCCAHIVNLIVNEGLKDLHDSVESIQNAVQYVKSSPARLLKFKSCIEKEKIEYKGSLVMDVATRWNSTYMMLESAIKFQSAFVRLDEEDSQFLKYFIGVDGEKKKVGPPTDIDWENAKVFVKFLKTFYDVTLKFSASLYTTSNAYYRELCKIQSQLVKFSASKDPLLGEMASSMRSKYDKYWGNVENINFLLFVAVVSDPRYKLEYVRFSLSLFYTEPIVEVVVKKIEVTLERMYQQYLAFDSVVTSTQTSCGSSVSQPSASEVDGIEADEDVDEVLSRFLMRKKEWDCVSEKNDIDRYLLEPTEDPLAGDFDILGWWKVNNKYRVLSQIARDVLAIQVSTVASESAFSTGGRVLDPFRSSLSPNMVEALICTQNWLKATSEPIKVVDYFDEVGMYDEVEKDFKGISISSKSMDIG